MRFRVVGLPGVVVRTGARAGGGVAGTGLHGSVANRGGPGRGSLWGLGRDPVRDNYGEPRFLPVSSILDDKVHPSCARHGHSDCKYSSQTHDDNGSTRHVGSVFLGPEQNLGRGLGQEYGEVWLIPWRVGIKSERASREKSQK